MLVLPAAASAVPKAAVQAVNFEGGVGGGGGGGGPRRLAPGEEKRRERTRAC